MKNFYAIGMDYAWGHNSIDVFKDEVKKAKKNFVGAVFSPIGTKDFSTYITKIRQSGADACFIVMQGDDNNAFLSQAREYRLADKVQLLTSIVDLNSIHAVGDAALGLVGSTRYMLHHRQSGEQGSSSQAWRKEYGADAGRVRRRAVAGLPDPAGRHREGRQHRRRQAARRRWRRWRSTRSRARWRSAPATIRRCSGGYMVKVVKKEGFKTADPGDHRDLPGR